MNHVPATFGAELRRRRLASGLSLSELARQMRYDKGYLSRVENGRRRAGADLARQCDAVLGADGALARLATQRDCRAPSGDPGPGAWSLTLGSSGDVELTTPASALHCDTVPMIDLGAAEQDDPVHGAATVVLDAMRRLARHHPPMLVLPTVLAQLRAVDADLARTSPAARARRLRLAAELAEFTGWLVQEAGDEAAAVWWTRRAAEYARRGGDNDMLAHLFVREANVSMYRADGGRTVALAARARSCAGASTRTKGMAWLREAQGFALLGDVGRCLHALAEGRAHLGVDGTEPAGGEATGPGMRSVVNPAAFVHGWCLFDLGCPSAAADVLGAELARAPARSQRSRARFGMRHALAQVAAGDGARAAATGRAALADFHCVDSATVRTDVQRLVRALERHRHDPALREVRHAAADALAAQRAP